jgi:hypothetical protein
MKGPQPQHYVLEVTPLESTEPIALDAERIAGEMETALEGSGYGVRVVEVEPIGHVESIDDCPLELYGARP